MRREKREERREKREVNKKNEKGMRRNGTSRGEGKRKDRKRERNDIGKN